MILKRVLGSSFSVCKFTQRGAQSFSNTSSLLCVHNRREKSVYIFFFFFFNNQEDMFDQSCTYCKAPLLVNGFFFFPHEATVR